MERKKWPWKKKTTQDSRDSESKNKDNPKFVPNDIRISQERYAQLSEIEDQVKILDGKLKDVTKELAKKDALVKEHSKIADELIKGWENEKAQASNLKSELESTKLESEEKNAGLDGALKECMKQLRAVKEEGEQKLHDMVLNKTKQWENVKFELQSKVTTLEEELTSSSQSKAEIETLKSQIESYKRKVSVLKYELDAVSVEVDMQTKEKNMCARYMEVVNRQHLEDVEKILNLEAEAQRLRSFVLKKFPGPTEIARMKKQVRSLRKSPANDGIHRENEILTCRLLEMETEMKVLKKASLSDHGTKDNETSSNDSVSRIPSLWKETSAYRSMKSDDMDDFLEMEKLSSASPDGVKNEILMSKLQAEISLAFDSHRKKNVDIRNLLTDISAILQKTAKSNDLIIVDHLRNSNNDILKKTIVQIHDFVVWIEKEAMGPHERRILKHGQRIMEFLSSESESKQDEFLQSLSSVLSEIREVYSRKLELGDGRKTDGFTHSSSDSENHQESSSILNNTSNENQLQVLDSENSKFLAVTQLRCMTESYTSLESHCQDLQKEINILRSNPETLGNQHVVKEERASLKDCLKNQNTEQERMQNGASIFQKPRCNSLFDYFCRSTDNPIKPKHRSTGSVSSNMTDMLGHQTDTTIRF